MSLIVTKKKFDFLIVGAGLFGSVFANLASKDKKKCLLIDKRKHIAGNCHTENIDGINVHKYGPHIFHTNDDKIWNFVNQFTSRLAEYRYHDMHQVIGSSISIYSRYMR
jgi:UDP-galactopyranose mutase